LEILKRPTPQTWVKAALANFDAVLIDHAHCEKKAAASAMSLVAAYPDRSRMVRQLVRLARQELRHFEQVHSRLVARGLTLGRDGGDPYAQALLALARSGEPARLIDRLLVFALIEARSHERLCLLAEALPDKESRDFYRTLAEAEAGHYQLFLQLARDNLGADVDRRLEALAEEESRIIEELPLLPRVH
jgi:tRNA-(ms[2]io[6]A)-hydroxylase